LLQKIDEILQALENASQSRVRQALAATKGAFELDYLVELEPSGFVAIPLTFKKNFLKIEQAFTATQRGE